jgi:hypothetical protein
MSDDENRRPVVDGWWEEYRCGCISETAKRKRDLLGYCPQHGADSRGAQKSIEWVRAAPTRPT